MVRQDMVTEVRFGSVDDARTLRCLLAAQIRREGDRRNVPKTLMPVSMVGDEYSVMVRGQRWELYDTARQEGLNPSSAKMGQYDFRRNMYL